MDVATPAPQTQELPVPPPSRTVDCEGEVDLEGNDEAFFEAARKIRADMSSVQVWDVAAGFKVMGQGRVERARVSLAEGKEALAKVQFDSWQSFTASCDKRQLAQLPVGLGQAMLAFVLFAAWAVLYYSAKFGPKAVTALNQRVVQPALTSARPYLDQGRERALQGLEVGKSKVAQLFDKTSHSAAAAEGHDV